MIWFLLFVLAAAGLAETCFRAGLRYHLKKFGKTKILILLLAIQSAWGQAFTPQDLPWLAQTKSGCNDIPCQIGNMFLRLKASDNPPNVGVSNWVDEIHGWNWFTNNPSTFITNSPANGVLFTNSGARFDAILYNTNNITVSPTQAMFMVIQPLAVAAAEEPVIGSIGGNTSLYGPTYFGAQAGFTCYQQANGGYRPWAKSGGLAVNKVIDVIAVGGPDPVQTYTNGIAALTYTGAGILTYNAIGDAGANNSEQMMLYIQEVIIFSNAVALTSLNVSNLHYYATNTYGPYAP